MIGIPYFAYMLSVMSDEINKGINLLQKNIVKYYGRSVSPIWLFTIYVSGGIMLLILVPCKIFVIMEG